MPTQDELDRLYPAIADLAALARWRLPPAVWDYVDSGTGDDIATADNQAAFARVRLTPQVLAEPGPPDLAVTLFGQRHAMPVGFAPVGGAGLLRPGAERMLAGAAAQAGVPYCLSTYASATPEEVGPVAGDQGWFQLYCQRPEDITDDLIARAEASGFRVLVVTLDTPAGSRRERQRRAGLMPPYRLTPRLFAQFARHPRWALAMAMAGRPRLAVLQKYAAGMAGSVGNRVDDTTRGSAGPESLRRVRARWRGPLVAKGILSVEAVEPLIDLGFDAIWVSNHGGRQFDAAPPSLEALPRIVARVSGRVPVLFDGGIRSGTDVLRAVALGADFTFVGRAGVLGAAALGADGAAHVLRLLKLSMQADLGQMGVARPEQVRARLWPQY